MAWTHGENEIYLVNTILQDKVEGGITRGSARQWLGDIKESMRLSSNYMWKEQDGRVHLRMCVDRVAERTVDSL